MNFLGLVNRARRECGVPGSDLTTLSSGLSAEGQRFKDWVADAWKDLQTERTDWQWMRKDFSFSATVAGGSYYTASQAGAADMAEWKRDSFRAYTTSIGYSDEQIVPFMEWDTWRNVYQFGANRSAVGRPVAITIKPDKSLAVGPLPNDTYTVLGEYYRRATDLTSDTDDPSAAANGLPERYHMLLVYMAMESYAEYEGAPEVLDRATRGSRRMRNELQRQYLPAITFGPPLA